MNKRLNINNLWNSGSSSDGDFQNEHYSTKVNFDETERNVETESCSKNNRALKAILNTTTKHNANRRF